MTCIGYKKAMLGEVGVLQGTDAFDISLKLFLLGLMIFLLQHI